MQSAEMHLLLESAQFEPLDDVVEGQTREHPVRPALDRPHYRKQVRVLVTGAATQSRGELHCLVVQSRQTALVEQSLQVERALLAKKSTLSLTLLGRLVSRRTRLTLFAGHSAALRDLLQLLDRRLAQLDPCRCSSYSSAHSIKPQ